MRTLFLSSRFIVLGLFSLSALSSLQAQTPASASEESALRYFRDLAETRQYGLGRPVSPRITPDGSEVLFLRSGPRSPVMGLYALDLASGRERELITPAQLLGSQTEQISAEEKARRERARMTLRGFTHFELSEDGRRVLLSLSGRLYVVERASGASFVLPGTGWIDPRFSPDSQAVAGVHEGELCVVDLNTRQETRLSSGATETLTHGVAEFVAQEEMDRAEGYWWSPDSRSLAFQETDESPVEARYIADPLHPERAPQRFAYPRAGSPNAIVRLGLLSRSGGPALWVRWDNQAFPYLTRVHWDKEGGRLTLLVQNRHQTEQRLLLVNTTDGGTTELLRESDPAWLDLDRTDVYPRWLKSGGFLWSSQEHGSWQVELRDEQGRLVRELSPRGFAYRSLVGVDEEKAEILLQGGPEGGSPSCGASRWQEARGG